MVARRRLIAGAGGLLIAGAALALASTAGPGAARPGEATPPCRARGVPPPAERIAATTATFNSIEAKIAAGQIPAAALPGSDGAGRHHRLRRQRPVEDGESTAPCVTVAYVVTNPDPDLAASMASYDTAMDLPPANITDMALPAPANPSFTCQIECSTGEDQLDAEAIHSMAPFANIIFVHPSVPETIGMQGWPQVAQAIKMIADQHLADVITVSLGDGETDFINDPTNPAASQQAAIHSLDPAFLDAAVHHIPVMFASGDCGPTDPPVLGDTGQCTPADRRHRGSPGRQPVGHRGRRHDPQRWPRDTRPAVPRRTRCGPPRTTTPTRRAPASPPSTRSRHGSRASRPWPASPAAPTPTSRWTPPTAPRRRRPPSRASWRWPPSCAAGSPGHDQPGPGRDRTARHGGRHRRRPGRLHRHRLRRDRLRPPRPATTSRRAGAPSSRRPSCPLWSRRSTACTDRYQPSRQAHDVLTALQANISASPRKVAHRPDRHDHRERLHPRPTPNGTTVEDGFGVFPPLPGQFGVTRPAVRRPDLDGARTDLGQRIGHHHRTWLARRPQPLAVSGPDGNGIVTVTIDTTGMAVGTYTVTITGRLLTQTISFQVNNPNPG